MNWTPYSVLGAWVDGFDIYLKCSDGTWVLDLRKYSHANHPQVKHLIDHPEILADIRFDEDGFPEWPNGFAPDPDIFRDEGTRVVVNPGKAASSLLKKVTAALNAEGVPTRTTSRGLEVQGTPPTRSIVFRAVRASRKDEEGK